MILDHGHFYAVKIIVLNYVFFLNFRIYKVPVMNLTRSDTFKVKRVSVSHNLLFRCNFACVQNTVKLV
jgi:hypothetical protein